MYPSSTELPDLVNKNAGHQVKFELLDTNWIQFLYKYVPNIASIISDNNRLVQNDKYPRGIGCILSIFAVN